MKNTEQHIAPETETLFEQFMEETAQTKILNSSQSGTSDLSPASLLKVLNEARALISGLESQNKPENVSESALTEMNTRLSQLEIEISKIKTTISSHMDI